MDYKKAITLKKGYPEEIKEQIKIYTIDKHTQHTNLIGSFSYRSGNASDIDLLEEIKKDTPTELIYIFCENIKKVINDITLRKDQIYTEVKCGIDHLFYDIDYGKCKNNTYYMPSDFFETMILFYNRKLITKPEMTNIMKIQEAPNKGQYEYEVIQDIMRQHYILRWSANEIMQGFKILVTMDNVAYKYTLNMAVVEKSAINIEGIFISDDNKYVECSNFIWLEYLDKKGDTLMLNMPDLYLQKKDYYFGEDLKKSMYVLLYSKYKSFNPFKAVKRMFSYARHFKLLDILKITYNIINSQIGNLYNLNTQLKTISKVLKTHEHKGINMMVINHQIDYIRWNIQGILLRGFDCTQIVEYLTYVMSKKTLLTQTEVAESLDNISKSISSFIYMITINIMKKHKIYPLPQFLTPKIKPF